MKISRISIAMALTKLKIGFTFLSILMVLLISFPSFAAEKESAYDRVMRTGTIRCGYGIWPPFFEVDVNTGKLKGLMKEISDEIGQILNLKIEYIPIVAGQNVQELNTGKIDAVCGDGPWILAGIKYLNFTNSYLYAESRIYGRSNEKFFANLKDFNKPEITFIGIDGDVTTDLVQRTYPQAKLRTLPGTADPSQLFMDIATHKADFVITDPLTAELFMKNNPGKIKQAFGKPVAVYGAGFSVAKDNIQLLITLNEAIKAANNIGLIDKALKQYDPEGKTFLPAAKSYEMMK